VATCPSGHESASDDFCDVCGVLIGAPPSLAADGIPDGGSAAAAGSNGSAAAPGGASGPAIPAETCPRCGVTKVGQFCESCGYAFAAADQAPGPPPAGLEWAVVVTADPAYYDSVQTAGAPDAASIAFPAYYPQRRFQLTGAEVRIGRRSASSGINPEIDLSVAPADPGVSRLHAVLLRAPDGSWSVLDPGSANGTTVNGREIPPGRAVPLHDGDRIHLGAWTQLRIVREA
jgi:FHA domain